jgi:hypothetical protein
VVFFGTIFIASAIYLFENHFSELFLNEGKNYIITELETDWDEELSYVADSVQKDSLKTLIKEFILHYKEFGDIIETSQSEDTFTKSIINAFKDSIITSQEIADVTELLLKVKNEKHKSN